MWPERTPQERYNEGGLQTHCALQGMALTLQAAAARGDGWQLAPLPVFL